MLFVAGQFFADVKSKVKTEREEHSIRQQVRDELYSYNNLKAAWGLGHIQIKITKERKESQKKQRGCVCHQCEKPMTIIGYYRDYYELTKQSMYLGRSYANALSRMTHVKSFL